VHGEAAAAELVERRDLRAASVGAMKPGRCASMK
jgi:hypothetical protein